MKQKYSHLTEENCLRIYECLLSNDIIPLIAKKLGYHKSTIYRELAGNSGKFGYRPDFACQQYAMRRRQKPGKIENNPELKLLILESLKEGWSPDQISGRIKLKSGEQIISHESIYCYIYSPENKDKKLYKYLRRKRVFRYPSGRRKSQKNTLEKVSIHERAIDSGATHSHHFF